MNTFFAVTVGWSFAAAILWISWLFRCKHAWELVDKTELPAPLETMQKTIKDAAYWPSDLKALASKTVILALRCPKCGAAKIFKESSN